MEGCVVHQWVPPGASGILSGSPISALTLEWPPWEQAWPLRTLFSHIILWNSRERRVLSLCPRPEQRSHAAALMKNRQRVSKRSYVSLFCMRMFCRRWHGGGVREWCHWVLWLPHISSKAYLYSLFPELRCAWLKPETPFSSSSVDLTDGTSWDSSPPPASVVFLKSKWRIQIG